MPRPNPWIASSAYSAYDEQALTPRTPHSRAGRTEEARFDADDDGEDANSYELEAQQHAPLLTSSASVSFPHRRSPNVDVKSAKPSSNIDWTLVRRRIPLVVGLASVILLAFLVILSVETPEKLHTYLHGSPVPSFPNSSTDASTENNASHSMGMLMYEGYESFPLTPLEYRNECSKFLAGMKGPMGTYWYIPPGGPMDVPHPPNSSVCTSTITYMLDGYVGLAADLALMAQAAGLARETNKTFFIDDRNWNRGRWSDHFQDVRVLQPGPEPDCLPPPPEELVACPRTARHWVINSRTALFHFGHHFMDEFEDPYARELRRAKPIFRRAASSFAQTVRPNAESAARIQVARQQVGSSYIAAHVRHGDRRTEAWEYHGGYVPLVEYANAVRDMSERAAVMASENANGVDQRGTDTVWIASDDPFAQQELAQLLTDSDQPMRVYSLERSTNAELRSIASREAYVQAEFAALSEEQRIRLTRGALVDFALVSGLWTDETADEATLEGVICTISSNFCKLAAVGLGWDQAFGFAPGDPDRTIMTMDEARKRWVEIDLKGSVDPVWRAFELF